MAENLVALSGAQFALIYLLLLVILYIMKKAKVQQSTLLFWASLRMTLQLILSGYILTYIFDAQNPWITSCYIASILLFSVYIVLSKNKHLNTRFQGIIACSLIFSGLLILVFFIMGVVGVNFFNPQYVIPIGGMLMGNAMTGVSLGLKTFSEQLDREKNKIQSLLNMGVKPQNILNPMVQKSLETALLPTLNSMLGMGVVSLPGMMTGQILSGTLPMTAIYYQIAIIIAISATVCLSVFFALTFGSKTLYNAQGQIPL